MNIVTANKAEISPFIQILLLFCYALAGATIFLILGLGIVFLMYGSALMSNVDLLLAGDVKYIAGFKVIQILSSIGTFIVPALLLAVTAKKKVTQFYGFEKPKIVLLFIVLVIMITSMPFIEWSAVWNQKMILPDFLKNVEQWMKEKEESLMRMTMTLITVHSYWDFFVNLIMIAVLPAIGEELFFRAGLQGAINKMFLNPHVAIWVTAIIFSAIHMQFYGFLPRMLLGAGFGYLYYFSGSIWYAILAHFINNAYAVCAAFYMQMHNMPLDKADEPIGFPWYGYLISAIITLTLFKYFKNQAERGRKLD